MQKVAYNVQSFAARQGGHVTRAQLERTGMSDRTIANWVSSGKLIRIYRGVYAVGHRQVNPIHRAHAILLAGGPAASLAGAWALVLWGIWRRWPQRGEILLSSGDRRPNGLIVHTSQTVARCDVTIVQGLRVTSPARTLLDTAARLTPDQRTRAFNDLRLRGLLTLEQLRDVVSRNPTHPAVTLLEPHLDHAQPEPTRSFLEEKFLPLLRKHNLPTPQVNVHIAGYRVDAYFADHSLVVELDGWLTHGTRLAFLADRRQDFEILQATGLPTVRLAYEDVTDAVIVQLGELLRQRRAARTAP